MKLQDMTLQEARRLSKLFPDRYKLEAKMCGGDDRKDPLFIWRLLERKDFSDWEVICNPYPFGVGTETKSGKRIQHGIGEWLLW